MASHQQFCLLIMAKAAALSIQHNSFMLEKMVMNTMHKLCIILVIV